eukprot:g16477.t1
MGFSSERARFKLANKVVGVVYNKCRQRSGYVTKRYNANIGTGKWKPSAKNKTGRTYIRQTASGNIRRMGLPRAFQLTLGDVDFKNDKQRIFGGVYLSKHRGDVINRQRQGNIEKVTTRYTSSAPVVTLVAYGRHWLDRPNCTPTTSNNCEPPIASNNSLADPSSKFAITYKELHALPSAPCFFYCLHDYNPICNFDKQGDNCCACSDGDGSTICDDSDIFVHGDSERLYLTHSEEQKLYDWFLVNDHLWRWGNEFQSTVPGAAGCSAQQYYSTDYTNSRLQHHVRALHGKACRGCLSSFLFPILLVFAIQDAVRNDVKAFEGVLAFLFLFVRFVCYTYAACAGSCLLRELENFKEEKYGGGKDIGKEVGGAGKSEHETFGGSVPGLVLKTGGLTDGVGPGSGAFAGGPGGYGSCGNGLNGPLPGCATDIYAASQQHANNPYLAAGIGGAGPMNHPPLVQVQGPVNPFPHSGLQPQTPQLQQPPQQLYNPYNSNQQLPYNPYAHPLHQPIQLASPGCTAPSTATRLPALITDVGLDLDFFPVSRVSQNKKASWPKPASEENKAGMCGCGDPKPHCCGCPFALCCNPAFRFYVAMVLAVFLVLWLGEWLFLAVGVGEGRVGGLSGWLPDFGRLFTFAFGGEDEDEEDVVGYARRRYGYGEGNEYEYGGLERRYGAGRRDGCTKDSPHDLHQQADNLGKKDGAMKSGEGSRSDASGQEAEPATARPEKSPPPESSPTTSEQQRAHAATHASFRRYSKEYETLIQEAETHPKRRNLYYKEQNGVAAKMSTGIMNKLHLQAPASYGETLLLTDETRADEIFMHLCL